MCCLSVYELRSTWYAALPLAISLSQRAVGLSADVSLSPGPAGSPARAATFQILYRLNELIAAS